MNKPAPLPSTRSAFQHPGWVLAAGCLLAFLGAGINACFLLQFGTSVSHLTGDVSKVAMNLAVDRTLLTTAATHLTLATFGFLAGATLSGYFIHHPDLEFRRPYGRTIAATGLCFMAAHALFYSLPVLCIFLAAVGCGTQNALATYYRGIVLRTTHITGLLTDLGTALGMKLKGHSVPGWKLSVPFAVIFSFFIGALCGSLAFLWRGRLALLIYALLYIAGGLLVTIIKRTSA